MNNSLPNFMIIGAMRSGTTTLYRLLEKHFEICFSNIKEPHFFDIPRNFRKGIKYYKKYFQPNQNQKAIGEATASYLRKKSEVAKNIKNRFPNMKFIILLRNPVDRSFSHYFFHQMFQEKIKNKKYIYKSIDDMIKRTNFSSVIFKDSLYYNQLIEWFKYFPKKQFLIIQSETYFKNTREVLKQIYNFLKIKDLATSLKIHKLNTTTGPRKLNKIIRIKMLEYFKPHNKKLYKLLNKNFDWNK